MAAMDSRNSAKARPLMKRPAGRDSEPQLQQQPDGAQEQGSSEEELKGSQRETTMKRPAGNVRPHFVFEYTRQQVMCRTGHGGKGSSFAIPFGTDGPEKAKKKAM
eukprot:11243036-Alexandrium_andersonii.AAC.1